MVRGGIFGPSLSGKTTLAKALSKEYWAQNKMRSLVLDLNNESWGEQALVTADEKTFWPMVWRTNDCLVIVDEGTETIRRDKTLVPAFTRLRHHKHKLLVVGHSGTNLLPIMRQQIDTLYLFLQDEDSAKQWAKDFIQKDLLQAVELQQFEFLYCRRWQPCKKLRLKL